MRPFARQIPQQKVRTQADHMRDAIGFIYQATDRAVLAMTAERLCDSYGVKKATDRADVATKLADRQAMLGRLL